MCITRPVFQHAQKFLFGGERSVAMEPREKVQPVNITDTNLRAPWWFVYLRRTGCPAAFAQTTAYIAYGLIPE